MENQEMVTPEQMDEFFQKMNELLDKIVQRPQLWGIPEVKENLQGLADDLEKVLAKAKEV